MAERMAMKLKEKEVLLLNALETLCMFAKPGDLQWSLTHVVMQYVIENDKTFDTRHVENLHYLLFFLKEVEDASRPGKYECKS